MATKFLIRGLLCGLAAGLLGHFEHDALRRPLGWLRHAHADILRIACRPAS